MESIRKPIRKYVVMSAGYSGRNPVSVHDTLEAAAKDVAARAQLWCEMSISDSQHWDGTYYFIAPVVG